MGEVLLRTAIFFISLGAAFWVAIWTLEKPRGCIVSLFGWIVTCILLFGFAYGAMAGYQ